MKTALIGLSCVICGRKTRWVNSHNTPICALCQEWHKNPEEIKMVQDHPGCCDGCPYQSSVTKRCRESSCMLDN
jgi:hypothetical protein